MTDTSSLDEAYAINSVRERRALWERLFRWWNFLNYFLGVLGLVTTLSGVLLPVFRVNSPWLELVAGLSAIIFGIVAYVQPPRRARAFIEAWRVLDVVWHRFAAGKATIEELLEALRQGEELLACGQPY